MTITKSLNNERGSVFAISLVVCVLSMGIVFFLLNSDSSLKKVRSKSAKLSNELFVAHDISALFKQEILTNYTNFQAGGAWTPCLANGANAGTMTNFLSILDNPGDTTGSNAFKARQPANCKSVNLTFAYLQTTDITPLTQVATQNIKTKSFVPTAAISQAFGRFNAAIRLSEVNSNPSRNLLIGSITVNVNGSPAPGARELTNTSNIRFVVDAARTVATPSGGPTCHVCRTTPGSVCCQDSTQLSYLEAGTGRIIDFTYDPISFAITTSLDPAAADPQAVSVKNLPLPTYYHAASFCVPGIQSGTPVLYVVDAAAASGINYFLTVHGNIYQEGSPISSPPTLIANDPKVVSIAYDDNASLWYLLRSDGAVVQPTDIANPSTYVPLPNLKLLTAQALTFGKGPTSLPPCP